MGRHAVISPAIRKLLLILALIMLAAPLLGALAEHHLCV